MNVAQSHPGTNALQLFVVNGGSENGKISTNSTLIHPVALGLNPKRSVYAHWAKII